MAYLDELIRQTQEITRQAQTYAEQWGITPDKPYASFYPGWEINTPQYLYPNAYNLAQRSYRVNEVAYACVNLRMQAISEAPLLLYKQGKEDQEEVDDDAWAKFWQEPIKGVSAAQFWSITEMYLQICGFAPYEAEFTKAGQLLRLWPMRPDWCSFLRGEQQPQRAIRYQPYGLPFVDIPIERTVIFQYFDPIHPLLKPFSPTMVALDIIDTDNNMTGVVNTFLKQGAFLGGVLTTDQPLQDAEAEHIRSRWRNMHGGANNAGDIAVFGKGISMTSYSNTFRDMVFPEVDGRSEGRICQAYRVPPILINAKLGIDRATYSNYEQARKAFYEETISAEWKLLAAQATTQLMPHFRPSGGRYWCGFDTGDVTALQEDRTVRFQRAVQAAQANVITRDEARVEMGFDPIDEIEVFVGGAGALDPGETAKERTIENEERQADLAERTDKQTDKQKQDEEEEEKKFREFAKRRIKENKRALIPCFEFKHVRLPDQRLLLAEFGFPVAGPADLAIMRELKSAVSEVESMVIGRQPLQIITDTKGVRVNDGNEQLVKMLAELMTRLADQPAPTVYVNLPEQPAPVVTVTVPEVKAPPVNVEVRLPDPKPRRIHLELDAFGNPIGARSE